MSKLHARLDPSGLAAVCGQALFSAQQSTSVAQDIDCPGCIVKVLEFNAALSVVLSKTLAGIIALENQPPRVAT